MPSGVQSIEKLADGFLITLNQGKTLQITSADIPANIKARPIADIQAWVNDWLLQHGYYAQCIINSITPLDIDIMIGSAPVDPTIFNKLPRMTS